MKLKSFINILFFGFQIYIKQNCYNYQKNVLQMIKEWHYYSIFIFMARQKNAISSVQLTVSVTERVREHLDRMTETGMFGKNAAETANLLLIDSIREYIEKGSTFLDSKSEDQKSLEIPK